MPFRFIPHLHDVMNVASTWAAAAPMAAYLVFKVAAHAETARVEQVSYQCNCVAPLPVRPFFSAELHLKSEVAGSYRGLTARGRHYLAAQGVPAVMGLDAVAAWVTAHAKPLEGSRYRALPCLPAPGLGDQTAVRG